MAEKILVTGADALPESLRRVQQIVHQPILFQELDITDEAALQELFSKHRFSAVMHFAGLKAVGESVQKPLEYYRVNLTGTIRLLEVRGAGRQRVPRAWAATVYGDPRYLPLDENHPVGGCTNAYGKSKYFIEEMIQDLCKAERDWNAVLLRYFNPIGAHESGVIGEDPQGIPNNLMPYVAQVAVGRREFLSVFGNDYKTDDGTGVRDYIHVVDLAKGHIAALKKLKENCSSKLRQEPSLGAEGLSSPLLSLPEPAPIQREGEVAARETLRTGPAPGGLRGKAIRTPAVNGSALGVQGHRENLWDLPSG
nr:PREDICTED: UDP-glucose 4-epimerase [Opisthocomus hoazin]